MHCKTIEIVILDS